LGAERQTRLQEGNGHNSAVAGQATQFLQHGVEDVERDRLNAPTYALKLSIWGRSSRILASRMRMDLMSTGLMEHSNTVQQHVNRWSPVINDPKSGEFVGQGGIGG
jgi:hypothetical protein